MANLKLGLQLGYWGALYPANHVQLAQQAEELGYDSVWTAESWGNDAFTPLAWIGAHTSKIRLGTSVAQLSARTPTSCAMAALSIDHMSGGRMMLGLGVSGPQVVEGWYGQPFSKPLARTREYVDIIRQVLAREAPVTNDGPHYPLPYKNADGWGMGKPLKPITHPRRKDLPIFLGAEGPKNVTQTAEIADGWLPLYYSPYREEIYADQLKNAKEGFEIAGRCRIYLCRRRLHRRFAVRAFVFARKTQPGAGFRSLRNASAAGCFCAQTGSQFGGRNRRSGGLGSERI